MKKLRLEGDGLDKQNEQTLFLIVVIAACLLLALVFIGLIVILRRFHCCRSFNALVERQRKWVIWNGCIRALLQSYLEMAVTVAAMYAMKQHTALGWLKALGCSVVLLAIPAVQYMSIKKTFYDAKIENPAISEKYGTLWSGINTGKHEAVQYFTLFMVRRVIFAFISVHLGPVSGGLVLITVCYVSLSIQVSYLLEVHPYLNKREQYLEVLSEILLLYFFYGVLIDELCVDPVQKFHVAWLSVLCFCALFLVNVANIIFDSISSNFAYLKALYIKHIIRPKPKLT